MARVDADGRALGIVHRDVSPGNVLVGWNGDVKLTDFGIAFARDRTAQTAAGHVKGTMAFMAPEQLMQGEIDGRTDLFALGCVLHLLLTGDSPLSGEHALADLVAGKPLTLAPGLAPDIQAILARATQLRRAERFADAGALRSRA